MAKVDSFLDQLKNYDKENMQPEAVKAVQFYLDKPDFDPERIKTKSQAAAGKKTAKFLIYSVIHIAISSPFPFRSLFLGD